MKLTVQVTQAEIHDVYRILKMASVSIFEVHDHVPTSPTIQQDRRLPFCQRTSCVSEYVVKELLFFFSKCLNDTPCSSPISDLCGEKTNKQNKQTKRTAISKFSISLGTKMYCSDYSPAIRIHVQK